MAVLIDLPVEIIQHIATHLPSCTDLLNFSISSHKIYTAVLLSQAVCRNLFLRTYDKPSEWEHYDYKRTYWQRHHILYHFFNDETPKTPTLTTQALNGIKELILEARTKNFPHLLHFASKSTNLITTFPDLSSTVTKLLMTLQLLLTNLALAAPESITWADDAFEIIHSQRWAYGDGTRALLKKDNINGPDLTRLWRTANFFLLHFRGLIGPEDDRRHMGLQLSGLKHDFKVIVTEDRGVPTPWETLEDEVSRYWFGFYVYLEQEDIDKLRSGDISTPLQDHYDGRLSIMELDITDTAFTGQGSDIEPFTVKGAISQLPSIESIPGWRRISFSNNYPEDRWLYEGCLLPGARTIIGRWTTFDEDEVDELGANGWEGPFIMWAVSREDYEYEKGLREHVVCDDDFLNH